LRVISGFLGGRKIAAPKGLNTRPTSDRVKESLFNILGNFTYEKRVLDLFAGSGALGIEALSRGADFCCFVDKDSSSIKSIKENIQVFGLQSKSEVYQMNYSQALEAFASSNTSFDLIFLDPPYLKNLVNITLKELMNCNILRKGGLIVAEHSKKDNVDVNMQNLIIVKQRQYGDTVLSFYTLKED